MELDDEAPVRPSDTMSYPHPSVSCWLIFLLLILLSALETVAFAGGSVVYVNWAAEGDNNGSSWHDAFTDLQDALSEASAGDEIWVASGSYRPTTGADREDTFQLKSHVAVYGGFSGSEMVREARSWQANAAILTGDIDRDGSLDGNSHHVVTGSGADFTAILDGFTITGGMAFGGLNPTGGGMFNSHGSPSLANIRFIGNIADEGGGMLNRESSPTLTNVSFVGNVASQGGGMANRGESKPTLINVTFSGNRGGDVGGGMHNAGRSQPIIYNSIFWNNSDEDSASASIVNLDSAAPSIWYSLVQGCNPGGNWNPDCGFNEGSNLFDADPLFIEMPDSTNAPTTVGNLRLRAGSPAADVGNNALVGEATDLAGNARIVNDTVDLGAYERPSGACPPGGKLFVGRTATEPADGAGWVSAFNDLQDALAVKESCEVWVAQGLYKPGRYASRSATFQLKNDLSVYGGFSGDELTLDQRNWQFHPTVLSGDIDSNDNTDESGIVARAHLIAGENAYHVVTASGTNGTAVLDGFVITAGKADGSETDRWGGGFYNLGGSPVLANVAFIGNAASFGAGMFNQNASPVMSNIEFRGNIASASGGALHNREGGSPILTDARFIENQANWGGGIYNYQSSPVLVDVVFRSNWGSNGGGIGNLNHSDPGLTNVSFVGNSATYGGGMYSQFNSNAILNNVIFRGNHASSSGGGVSNTESSPTLIGVSFSGNIAGNSGGGIDNYNGSNPVLVNAIIWNNQDDSGTGTATSSIDNDDSSTSIVSYSLIQGCKSGTTWNSDCGMDGGNIIPESDPQFVSTPAPGLGFSGNLHLQASSPAIDVGNNAVVSHSTDLDGNGRIVNDTVDLGAYEYFKRSDSLFSDRFEVELP